MIRGNKYLGFLKKMMIYIFLLHIKKSANNSNYKASNCGPRRD